MSVWCKYWLFFLPKIEIFMCDFVPQNFDILGQKSFLCTILTPKFWFFGPKVNFLPITICVFVSELGPFETFLWKSLPVGLCLSLTSLARFARGLGNHHGHLRLWMSFSVRLFAKRVSPLREPSSRALVLPKKKLTRAHMAISGELLPLHLYHHHHHHQYHFGKPPSWEKPACANIADFF